MAGSTSVVASSNNDSSLADIWCTDSMLLNKLSTSSWSIWRNTNTEHQLMERDAQYLGCFLLLNRKRFICQPMLFPSTVSVNILIWDFQRKCAVFHARSWVVHLLLPPSFSLFWLSFNELSVHLHIPVRTTVWRRFWLPNRYFINCPLWGYVLVHMHLERLTAYTAEVRTYSM